LEEEGVAALEAVGESAGAGPIAEGVWGVEGGFKEDVAAGEGGGGLGKEGGGEEQEQSEAEMEGSVHGILE
jgi:hypothetical protein